MRTLVQIVGMGLVGTLLGGCPATVQDVRTKSTNRREFTSLKSPENLSGCIFEAWNNEATGVTTSPKANGWIVLLKGGDWVIGVADINKSATGSRVSFNSDFEPPLDTAVRKTYLPALQRCL